MLHRMPVMRTLQHMCVPKTEDQPTKWPIGIQVSGTSIGLTSMPQNKTALHHLMMSWNLVDSKCPNPSVVIHT